MPDPGVPLNDAVRRTAEQNGVQQKFWDIFGKPHETSPETNLAILRSMGFDCASEEALASSVSRNEDMEWRRPLPPVIVADFGQPLRVPLRLPQEVNRFPLTIKFEDGTVREYNPDLTAARVERSHVLDRSERNERLVELPGSFPLGYHEIKGEGASARLIVTPGSALKPGAGKHAGLGVTLWGLRSGRNWGCGDFRDLRDLIDWAVPALHAGFIALNPLHAIHNRTPYNSSPYLPNSIFYRNFIYLDVEAVPGFESIRGQFETGDAQREKEELRATRHVEYERVAGLKRRGLDRIFAESAPSHECLEWIKAEGDLLRLYATYCALDEHLHAENPDLWVWPDWPEQYRDPENPAVAAFAKAHGREILFHGWLQWLIDTQIAAVQRHALDSGMSIGLYHDLALATDRCGSDLWAHRPFYVDGARVGSPPDDFSPTGQDWSFPPPDQKRHLENGYRLYAESIRKSMRHGGALRIDHVMRLFRLYWIPEGHDATAGAYVRDRAHDLVRILALESIRNGTVIVGEDLGTVETEVRRTLAQFGILSYRLLIFERSPEGFRQPAEYPEQALTATTTHDLPTIAGFWRADDIAARLRAGTIQRDSYESQLRERDRDKQHLLDSLFRNGLLPHDYERNASRIADLNGELHNAVAGFLAGTPCVLWLVNQEDITRELHQQNLPGTTAEYPNWCLKMRWSLEDLRNCAEAGDCATMIRHWIERSGRAHHGASKHA